jgi:hypothetical protein
MINLPQGFLRICWEHMFVTFHGREPPHDLNLCLVNVVAAAKN